VRTGLGGGAHVAQSRVGVGLVEVQTLDRGAEGGHDAAVPLGFHVGQDLRVDLKVPGVVELAGLADRACRRDGIPAAAEGHGGEARLIGVAVVRVRGELDHVIGTELVHHEGAGADRAEVGLGAFRRAGAEAVGELRGLDHRALGADEGGVGEGRRTFEGHAHGALSPTASTLATPS
jgi:hypothetical protein